MPKRYQNCTAKCPFSYKDDLPKIWVKPLPEDAKSPLPVEYVRRALHEVKFIDRDPLGYSRKVKEAIRTRLNDEDLGRVVRSWVKITQSDCEI